MILVTTMYCCRDIEVPAEAPEEIAQLIDDCLQPNPSKRPAAQDLVARLQVRALEPHGQRKTSFLSRRPCMRFQAKNRGPPASMAGAHLLGGDASMALHFQRRPSLLLSYKNVCGSG